MEKMFPLQAGYRDAKSAPHPLQIPWSVAEKAYCEYARQYGRGQSLERLAERGGFDGAEMDMLYPPWRDEVSQLTTLRQRAEAAERRVAELEGAVRVMAEECQAWNECPAGDWSTMSTKQKALVTRLNEKRYACRNNPHAKAAIDAAGGQQ